MLFELVLVIVCGPVLFGLTYLFVRKPILGNFQPGLHHATPCTERVRACPKMQIWTQHGIQYRPKTHCFKLTTSVWRDQQRYLTWSYPKHATAMPRLEFLEETTIISSEKRNLWRFVPSTESALAMRLESCKIDSVSGPNIVAMQPGSHRAHLVDYHRTDPAQLVSWSAHRPHTLFIHGMYGHLCSDVGTDKSRSPDLFAFENDKAPEGQKTRESASTFWCVYGQPDELPTVNYETGKPVAMFGGRV